MFDSVIIGDLSPYSVEGRGFTLELYFTGCPHRCKGCHNPELQEYSPKYLVSLDCLKEKLKFFLAGNKLISEVWFLGGEPLWTAERRKFVFELCKFIKKEFPHVKTVLFTGYEESFVKHVCPFLFLYLDYLKTGRYLEDKKCPKRLKNSNVELPTSNQKLFRVHNKSLIQIL